MSREIDERLVAMRFDNQQFEEGVKESLASLAALREGLDLDGAADSFNEVSKASEKYLQFKEPSKAAENLHTVLSKVGSVAKAAFGGMTAPIKAVGNAINGVYKDASRLFGLDIAYNLEQTAIKTLRAFTVEPLSTGFQEYETKVDSLKTIMTSTVETYTNKLRQQSAEALEQAEKERDAEIAAANERYAAEKKALDAEAKREKLSKEEKATRLEILNAQKEEAEKAAKERYSTRESQLVSYDERAHREVVKKSIEELNEYADNTIYNFQEMMKALPTLTNVGVEIEAATSMVKGMSNLAAYAGKGATEATFALRNLGQAMSLGYFQLMDWKTMEQQGLNTRDFVKTAIQMGLKTGTLIERNGKVYAQEMLEKYDQAIAEGQAAASKKKKQADADETLRKAKEKAEAYLEEVTADNFRESLKYKWFDKATIEDTFKIFSGDLTELDLLKMGYDSTADRDLINWFLKLGKEATTAATQVRTFSKMMDSLKEAAQSGWALSYEYIFGDDEQATKFWTPISNAISDVLDASAKSRNEALKGWSESFVHIEGQVKTTRDAIGDAIIQLVNVFATVKNAVSDAWSTIFGKFDKKRLTDITKGFAKFASSLQKWLGDKSIEDSRINKISSALEGFFSILHAVFGTVRDVFDWVGEKISPVFDWLFDKITSFGALLQEKFKGTKNLKEVFDVIKNSSSGNVRQALNWLADVPEKISSKWDEIKNWYNSSSLKGIVTSVWDGIINFFTAPEGKTSTFDRLLGWLKQAYTDLSTTWNEVKMWYEGSALKEVVDNVWDGIAGFFSPKVIAGKQGNSWTETESGFSQAIEWLSGAFSNISTTWESIKTWYNNSKLKEITDNVWDGILTFFTPKTKMILGKQGNSWTETESPFTSLISTMAGWIDEAKKAIGNMWDELYGWWTSDDNQIRNVTDSIWSGIVNFFTAPDTSFLSSISEFISNLWKTISGLFFPENLADETKSAHEAISELGGILIASASLTDAPSGKKEVKKTFFDGLLEYIEGLKQKFEALNIREFLSDLLGTVTDFFAPQTVIGKQGNTWQTSPFIRLGDSISEGWEEFKAYPIWADIGAFLGNTWGWISSLFTEKVTVEKDDGTQEVHSKIGAKLAEIKSGIEKIFDTFKTSAIWQNIGELIKDPWGWIKKIAGIATEKVAGAVESVKSAIDSSPALNTIATFISTVFTSLKELIAEANGSELGKNFVSSLSSFFDAIGNFFKMAGDLLNRVLKDVSIVNRQYLWFAITKAILNFSSALKDWKKSILTINRDSAGDAFVKFSASILMVSLAISTLGKMPIGQLAQGILAVGAVTVAITSIASAFKKIETGDSVKEMLKSGTVYLGGKLIDALGSMLTVVWTVSLVVNNIDSILSSISKYKFESGKFLEAITGILEIAFGAALLAAMVSKFQFTPQTLANVGYVIGSIAIALLGLLLTVTVIGGLIGSDLEAFRGNANNFVEFFGLFGRIVGAIAGAFVAEKIEGTANGISEASDIISQIPMDKLKQFFYAMGQFASIMSTIPDYSIFEQIFGTHGLGLLASAMPELGRSFKTFAEITAEAGDISNIDKATDFIMKMAESAKALAIADSIVAELGGRGLGSTDALIEHLNTTLSMLGESKIAGQAGYNFGGYFGRVGQLANDINVGIEEAALGISADPIILGIAKGLLQSSGELTPAIAKAIKDVYYGLNQIDSSVMGTGSTFVSDLFSQTEGLKESIPQFDSLFNVTDLQQSLNSVSTSLDFSGLEQTLSAHASEMSSILEGAFTLDGVNFGDDESSELEASWSSLFDTLAIEVNSKSETLGEDMAGALLAGFRSKAEELSRAISETIDTAPVITPVLDLGQFKRDAFGMRNLLPGTLSLNLAGAAVAPQDTSALSLEVLNRMADQNAAALTAMGEIMSSGLSYIGSMIGNIKFEMDGMAVGKAVFPYVDAELAKNLSRYLRNNNKLRK